MASFAINAAAPAAVVLVGSIANLGVHAPLELRRWSNGGFIGLINGGTATAPAPAAPAAAPPATPGSAVRRARDVPIGGQTGKPSLKAPFGVFRKHKPTKLPKGGPKPYDPATSP